MAAATEEKGQHLLAVETACGATTWSSPAITGVLSELLSAPGFQNLSTTGGLAGLTAVITAHRLRGCRGERDGGGLLQVRHQRGHLGQSHLPRLLQNFQSFISQILVPDRLLKGMELFLL